MEKKMVPGASCCLKTRSSTDLQYTAAAKSCVSEYTLALKGVSQHLVAFKAPGGPSYKVCLVQTLKSI